MTRQKFYLLILCLCLSCMRAMGTTPDRYTPVAGYPNTMTITAVVKDGETVINDVEVAAFASDECRGAIKSDSKGILYLTVSGDVDTKIVFKVWDGTAETVVDQDVTFSADHNLGTPAAPYVIQLGESVPVVTLDESATANTFTAQTGVNVQLTRTLSPDYWNTFCVPFSIPADMIEDVFGAGTEVMEMTSATEESIKFTTVTGITAGVPCIIMPARTVVNPEFTGVDIIAPESELVVGDASSPYLFVGTYCGYTMKTNKTEIFIKTDNTLAYPFIGGNKLKGMRAFIRKNTSVSSEVKPLSLIFGDQTTSIEDIENVGLKMYNGVYSLSGQYLGTSLDALPDGVYVVDGKKVIK